MESALALPRKSWKYIVDSTRALPLALELLIDVVDPAQVLSGLLDPSRDVVDSAQRFPLGKLKVIFYVAQAQARPLAMWKDLDDSAQARLLGLLKVIFHLPQAQRLLLEFPEVVSE